jgi:hypothetical protein
LNKIDSVRKTLKSVGTSIENVRNRYSNLRAGGEVVLANYMDVCIHVTLQFYIIYLFSEM